MQKLLKNTLVATEEGHTEETHTEVPGTTEEHTETPVVEVDRL